MNVLIKVLLIMGWYLLIALVAYFILYCKACKDYKTSTYANFEIYMKKEEENLGLMCILWPISMVVGIVLVSIDFIKSKIKKHYGV